MNEECLRAQQTLSEASDGVSVTAEDLKNAKAHCAACDECLAYVSALAALKKTPPPVAPQGLSDRVIAAVHSDAEQLEAEKIAAAALLASQAEQSAADAASGYPASGTESTAPRPAIRADNWKSWAPWAAAATVVLLIAGFAVMRGAAFIGGGSDAAVQTRAPSNGAAPPYAVEESAPQEDEAAATGVSQEGAEDAAYIDFGGWAYGYERTARAPSSPTTAGIVVTALDTEEPATQHTVYEGQSSNSLVLLDGEDYLAFELVSRSVQGREYAMVVGPIGSFGKWPLPPPGLPMPTQEDGSPVFKASVVDDHGQRIYVAEEGYPREGIAIAPNTSSNDPAAGNPNWTWWEPIP